MLVLGLDFEATDRDPKTSRITEIGAILFDAVKKEFWNPMLNVCVYAQDYPKQSEEVIQITGITDEMLRLTGYPPVDALKELNLMMSRVEYIIAHNGKGYDKPLYEEECKRLGITPVVKPWIDTMTDLPLPKECTSKKLDHLVSDHDIPWPRALSHRAVFDVTKMLLLVSKYDFAKDVVARSKEPDVIYRAMTKGPWEDGGASNTKAKECGFRWQEAGGKVYTKAWVTCVKKSQAPELEKKARDKGLLIKMIEERTPSV